MPALVAILFRNKPGIMYPGQNLIAFTEAAFGVRFDDLPEIYETNVASTLSEASAVSSSTPKGLDRDKIKIAAVDSRWSCLDSECSESLGIGPRLDLELGGGETAS